MIWVYVLICILIFCYIFQDKFFYIGYAILYGHKTSPEWLNTYILSITDDEVNLYKMINSVANELILKCNRHNTESTYFKGYVISLDRLSIWIRIPLEGTNYRAFWYSSDNIGDFKIKL